MNVLPVSGLPFHVHLAHDPRPRTVGSQSSGKDWLEGIRVRGVRRSSHLCPGHRHRSAVLPLSNFTALNRRTVHAHISHRATPILVHCGMRAGRTGRGSPRHNTGASSWGWTERNRGPGKDRMFSSCMFTTDMFSAIYEGFPLPFLMTTQVGDLWKSSNQSSVSEPRDDDFRSSCSTPCRCM